MTGLRQVLLSEGPLRLDGAPGPGARKRHGKCFSKRAKTGAVSWVFCAFPRQCLCCLQVGECGLTGEPVQRPLLTQRVWAHDSACLPALPPLLWLLVL